MGTVTCDRRSFLLDGRRRLLISGEVHYARSLPEEWPGLLDRCRACGLDAVASYVFWNFHEPERGVYDFSGRRDLGRFLQLCAERGLKVILRLGPYCCAEWNYGGFPSYLRDEPGIEIRTWNAPYIERAERYLRRLAEVVRPWLYSNGGPVILVQIENEYNNVAARYGEAGKRYLAWMAQLPRALDLTVPVLMCEGAAPGAIAALNGFSLDDRRIAEFRAAHPGLPLSWTECWTGWYNTWGYRHHCRSARNLGFHLLRFLGHGGSFWNYYMWHGGTNFGRNSMYLGTTAYSFDAPLDEGGEPTAKAFYLAGLHEILHRWEPVLLAGEPRVEVDTAECRRVVWSGEAGRLELELELKKQRGALRGNGHEIWVSDHECECAAPCWCDGGGGRDWEFVREPRPAERRDAVFSTEVCEQLTLTRDRSDYCWYAAEAEVTTPGPQLLTLEAAADLVYVYWDGELLGSTPLPLAENRGPTGEGAMTVGGGSSLERTEGQYGVQFAFSAAAGRHRLEIWCVSLGRCKGDWMISGPMNTECKGLWRPVRLNGRALGPWRQYPGLCGPGAWSRSPAAGPQWLRTTIPVAPDVLAAAIDFRLAATGLGKGFLRWNGFELGRHWLLPGHGYGADESWQDAALDGLTLGPDGEPTQAYYRIPPTLVAAENRLEIFEEQQADPRRIRLEFRVGKTSAEPAAKQGDE